MHISKQPRKKIHPAIVQDDVKKRTEQLLSQVPPNSAWGFAAADFLQHIEQKSETDYLDLLRELREDLHDGPGTMRMILGQSFLIFRKMLQRSEAPIPLPVVTQSASTHVSGTGK